jgi:hypothetical protein
VTARLRYALCALVLGGALIAGTAPAQAHVQAYHGSGIWWGPGFYTHGTTLEYHFTWFCDSPHHMHLNLERDRHPNPISQQGGWGTDKRLVDHTGDHGQRDNTFHIDPPFNWGRASLYRLSIHTAPHCHWTLRATY